MIRCMITPINTVGDQIQPVLNETSSFGNMMGDLKCVVFKCANQSADVFFVFPFQRKMFFGHPQESVGTMNHTSIQQEGKTYAARGG